MNDPLQKPAAEAGHDETIDATVRVVESSAEPVREADAPARLGDAVIGWWRRGSTDAKELADAVRADAQIAGERTQAYVREEPVKSVLIAAAAGAVLSGLLIASGKRKPRETPKN